MKIDKYKRIHNSYLTYYIIDTFPRILKYKIKNCLVGPEGPNAKALYSALAAAPLAPRGSILKGIWKDKNSLKPPQDH